MGATLFLLERFFMLVLMRLMKELDDGALLQEVSIVRETRSVGCKPDR